MESLDAARGLPKTLLVLVYNSFAENKVVWSAASASTRMQQDIQEM